jgi:hypothetical protein
MSLSLVALKSVSACKNVYAILLLDGTCLSISGASVCPKAECGVYYCLAVGHVLLTVGDKSRILH